MLQDLAALAPSVIVCAAFLVGVGALLRREMASRRRTSGNAQPGDEADSVRREGSET